MTFPAAPHPVDVSVVVPVYGGPAALAELNDRLAQTLSGAGLTYELILVDDRGSSESWPEIRELARKDSRVVGLRLSRNFGQHAATICGIEHARGDWIVTMDDDLEHPPESIPARLAAGNEECPLVYGLFPRRTHAGFRNLSSELMRWTLKRAFPDLNEHYSSFRAIHVSLARQLAAFKLNKPYIDGMLSWMTSSVATVKVTHGERRHGESTYTLRKLFSHAFNIFITFSNLPLRVASYGGAALAALSFLYMTFIVWAYFTGRIVNPGYTSLMSVILFACGVQLLILGVLGEYVARLMGAANRKPVFLIEKKTGSGRLVAQDQHTGTRQSQNPE